MRFSCTLCGDCCRGNQVVRLNDEDMELLARYENTTTEDLFKRKILTRTMDDSRPILKFKTYPIKQCRYLINEVSDDFKVTGRCALHPDFKPLVCHLAPLAREVEHIGDDIRETWSIVEPSPGCPGFGRGEEMVIGPPEALKERLQNEVVFMGKFRVK